MSVLPEDVQVDPKYLPETVTAAFWSPSTMRVVADAHCRHPFDHNVQIKAWILATLLDAYEERLKATA